MNDKTASMQTGTQPRVNPEVTPGGTVWYPGHSQVTLEHNDGGPAETFWVPQAVAEAWLASMLDIPTEHEPMGPTSATAWRVVMSPDAVRN
jgi:hypothetical protein